VRRRRSHIARTNNRYFFPHHLSLIVSLKLSSLF
jgi:hypothetical protein